MLKTLMNRYATPFTTGLFLVSLISGIAIFFHWGDAYFRGMHEWLSMVLILPFVFHVVKNWRPLTSYLSRGWLVWPLAACTVAGLIFAAPAMMPSTSGVAAGGNPAIALMRMVSAAPLEHIAPLTKKTPEQLADALKAKGFKVESVSATLNDIAAASGKEPRDALPVLTAR
jgi:ABC-type transport system involved in multi-copper enzyme maturation permease subunit